MVKPSDETVQAWIALNRAQRMTFRAIETALRAEALPPLRWYDVLWELDRAPAGLRPFELERRLLFDQSNLSRVISRLVAASYVQRVPVAEDGRGHMLRITSTGRALRRRMWDSYARLIQTNIGDRIDREQAVALAALLQELLQSDETE